MNLLEPMRDVVIGLAVLVDIVGVVVVLIAVIRVGRRYLSSLLDKQLPFPPAELRVELGRSVALSLEFLLGADILRTAIEPTWDEIAHLAAIAGIRTVLNYFLDRELAAARRRGQVS